MDPPILVQELEVQQITVARTNSPRYIDASHIEALGDAFQALVQGKKKPCIIFSLEETTYFSSSALNHLIKLHTACIKAGGQLRVCNVHPDIEGIIAMSELPHKKFNIDRNLKTSIQRCGAFKSRRSHL